MTITSSDNPAIREVRRLSSRHGRSRSELFLAEGEDLLAAAASAGWSAERILVREGSGLDGDEVESGLLDSVSSLGSGTRAIGLFTRRIESSARAGLVVHLDGLADPGNVGTILRSAHAFGATAVSVGPRCCDPFAPKAVRASMGAIFHLPIVEAASIGALPGVKVALEADSDGGPLPDGDLVLVVGAERAGVSPEVLSQCDRSWSIPMAPGVDSLNAAVACSLALYAANRIPG